MTRCSRSSSRWSVEDEEDTNKQNSSPPLSKHSHSLTSSWVLTHIEKSAVRTHVVQQAGYSVSRSKKLNKDPSPVVTSLASDWKVEKDLFLELA